MSIPKGQIEAAQSLGMRYTGIMKLIVLPQAFSGKCSGPWKPGGHDAKRFFFSFSCDRIGINDGFPTVCFNELRFH
jgi:hypothetical protein